MTIVNFNKYYEDRCEFNRKHGNYRVIENEMTDNCYHKEYIYEDGAIFFEKNGPVYEKAEVEVKGVKCIVDVKLFRTEYWSTDFESRYMYERY